MKMRRLQRLLACMLLAAALTAAVPTGAAAADFSDVPASHWAAESITRAVELGYFQGESASVFGVGRPMTRASFAVVLCRFFGWESVRPDQSTYSDVPADAWYFSAVETAYANGAVTHQTDTFRPADAITREEMAVMLVRALGYGTIAGLAQDLDLPFTDVTTNAGYIAVAHDLGLFSGTSATAFSPDRTATREQVAVILMRLYDKLHQGAPALTGIFSGAAPDLTGFTAAAVSGARLVYSGQVNVASLPEAETAAAQQAAIRSAGARALLHVTGSSNVLRGSAAATAQTLAEAVEAGGWDGVMLDLPELAYENRKDFTALVQAVDAALGEKTLFVVADVPAWGESLRKGYDFPALAAAADCLVLRVAPYAMKGDFPAAPSEPLEEVYYALSALAGTVPAEKLSLLLTTTGSVWTEGRRTGEASADEIGELLDQRETGSYYADRYASAYLTCTVDKQETVIWYLDGRAVTARTALAGFFGVTRVCVSDASSLSAEVRGALTE